MNPELKGLAKTGGVIAAGAAIVGGVTWLALPAAPAAPRNLHVSWTPTQTEVVERSTNGVNWEVATNSMSGHVVFPINKPQEFYRTRAKWDTRTAWNPTTKQFEPAWP